MTRIDRINKKSKRTVSVFKTYVVASAYLAWLKENTSDQYQLVVTLR